MNHTNNVWKLKVANAISSRANCLRAQVGCVLFDSKDRILSCGYNSPPSGHAHCSNKCPGMLDGGVDDCMSIHAEANALMFCKDIDKIDSCAVTMMPCFRCMKLLANTPVKTIIFIEYGKTWSKSIKLAEARNITLIQGYL